MALMDSLGIIVSTVLTGLAVAVAVVLYRRQFTVGARITVAREAAGQLLTPLQVLEENLRDHSVANTSDPLDVIANRWKTTVEPLRLRLAPDLVSRIASLEYILELAQTGAIDSSEPGWTNVWVIALADVRAATQNYSRGLRPESATFPSVDELKKLIIEGQQLGTGFKEIVAVSEKRMSSRSTATRGKWLALLITCSVLFGASVLFLVLSVVGVIS